MTTTTAYHTDPPPWQGPEPERPEDAWRGPPGPRWHGSPARAAAPQSQQRGAEGPRGAAQRPALEPGERPAVPPERRCSRCQRAHTGLCARQDPRPLAALGICPAWTDNATMAERRQADAARMRGVTSTRGKDRELAIASCGRFGVVASADGVVELRPQRCRDRGCSSCQAARSRALAADLRAAVITRSAALCWPATAFTFMTLTPVKPGADDPRVAIDATRRFLRALTNSKTSVGREFHRRFAGWYWAHEVTWSERGTMRRDGSRVGYSGYHAHVHGMLEPRPERVAAGLDVDDLRWLVNAWCAITGARPIAQHWAPLDERRIGQLAKYCAKPIAEGTPDSRLKALIVALEGRRTHYGGGTWKRWRTWLDAPEHRPVGLAHDETDRPVGIIEILALASDRETWDDPIVFRTRGRDVVCRMPARAVAAGMRHWARALIRREATQVAGGGRREDRAGSRSATPPTPDERGRSQQGPPQIDDDARASG